MEKNSHRYQLELNREEVALLWQLMNSVNVPGQVAEVFVSIKGQVRQAMRQVEIEAKETPSGTSP